MANFYKKDEIPANLLEFFVPAEIGLEATPDQYIAKMVDVFREVKRVLKDDGTLWLNIWDSYNAHPGQRKTTDQAGEKQQSVRGATAAASRSVADCKPKDLIGIPWLLAFSLRADGWYLRQEVIWHKPNPMPESVTDRCTKSHESIFLLAKSEKYYFDNGAIAEQIAASTANDSRLTREGYETGRPERGFPGGASHGSGLLVPKGDPSKRNKRSVWTVATTPYSGAHFATFPTALIEPCILAGAPAGGVVIDPFFGSGTTGQVAQALGRQYIGCELNPDYKVLQDQRLCQPSLLLEAA